MDLSENKLRAYRKRLLLSRMRILCHHGFFGLLLMHMHYAIREDVPTACTDGVKIVFGAKFLDELSDQELDFVMMHEILHVALRHCLRTPPEDPERYNIAADIVVNSNILLENDGRLDSITLGRYGISMHTTPSGEEGYRYTAEQVYDMLPASPNSQEPCASSSKDHKGKKQPEDPQSAIDRWDDHSPWGNPEGDALGNLWKKRFQDAAQAMETRDPDNSRGLLPAFARRILKEMKKPQIDWRVILNDFVQEEITDYSFSPPDRRFEDSPFFLPDFSWKENTVENVLFMIDTSASISDDALTAAYSEVQGAIDQFDGRLSGWLGFFDASVTPPKPFCEKADLKRIEPIGGGGTSFQIIFDYVRQNMSEKLPASIILLTDGYAPFPAEKSANGIPVLWILNNEDATPPWGRVARILP